MANFTTYLDNALIAHAVGKTAFTMPTTYLALFRATAGQSPRSTAVSLNATTFSATPNGRMYRCTTAGTTGSGEPTWPTTNGGTVPDGTAVWTEMTPDFLGNTNLTECTYTGYARVATTGNWGAAAAGAIANNAQVNAPQCTGGSNVVGMYGLFDASTAGNLLMFGPTQFSAASIVFTVSTAITPQFLTGQITATIG